MNRLIASIRNYKSGVAENHQTNVTTEYAYWADSLLKTVRNPRNYDTQYAWDAGAPADRSKRRSERRDAHRVR